MIAHFSVAEIKDIIRRRKKYFFIPFLIITSLSVIGAFVLPKRYESYITILLKKDQMQNPLFNFHGGGAWGGDDQLASFDQIIYSRTIIRRLLDTLGRKPDEAQNEKIDDLIEATRKKVFTELRGDGFRITFVDKDPFACQKAATALCNMYIETSLKSDRQQAEETVKFLTAKVEELRAQFEKEQSAYLKTRQKGIEVQPFIEGELHGMLGRTQEDFVSRERALELQERLLSQLKMFQENLDNAAIIAQISTIKYSDIRDGETNAFVDSLKAVSVRYSRLLDRYTPRYPAVQSMRKDLSVLLDKSIEALKAKITLTKAERASLANLRDRTQRDIASSINVSVIGTERDAEYARVKRNYDDAKQKLDQAIIDKELAERGGSKYVILDPPEVPAKPTKPNKTLIMGGGGFLGLVVGIAAMFLMEYYDSTIRRTLDIEVFNKPILGYLP
jgi:uncharacterized protein involved in exopolysaccharide biosynthesis